MAIRQDEAVGKAHFVLNSGDKIPALGLGTWKAKPNVVRDAVYTAIVESGYRHIDAAHIYGNEKEVGVGLKAAFDTGIKREDVFVTSKLWVKKTTPDKVKPALLKTLSDLGLEYLDLYLIHWPVHTTETASEPPKKGEVLHLDTVGVWKAMEALVKEKLVRNIGVSNFTVPKMDVILKEATIVPAVNQVEMHPALKNDKLLEHAKNNNYHITAYSPLGNSSTDLFDELVVTETAEKLDKQPAQILLRWLIQRGVSTIPKSSTPHRIAENKDIFNWSIPEEDFIKISNLPYQKRTNLGWELFISPEDDEKVLLNEFWDGEVYGDWKA